MSATPPTSRAFTVLAAALLMGTALAGCVTQDAQAASGALYVKDDLTDEAAEVHVTFTQAEMLPAQASEWVSVYEGEQTIELLSLSGSADKAELANFTIEPGEYDRLRLTIQNVTVVHHNGTTEELVIYGNVVTIGEDLTFTAGGELEATLDFDLETGVNLTAGEYVPVVGDIQRSDEDADDDGQPDFVDTDDDGDGIPDAEDDDRDGDGQPDMPTQSQAFDRGGLFGLCTAWENNEEGREHSDARNASAENGTDENETADNETAENDTADNETEQDRSAANATAFQWLKERAAAQNQTVSEFCEEQARPGAPDDLTDIGPDNLPDKARQALEGRHLGPPEDRPGAPEDRGEDGRERGDQARGDDARANESDREAGQDGQNRTDEDDRGDANRSTGDGDPSQQDGADENGSSEDRPGGGPP